MADESEKEKRFHAVMDKLFHSPPPPTPNPNSSSISLRGKKRPLDLKSRGDVAEGLQTSSGGTAQAPMCRPWDRGDFLRRLATFKSMKWFAKPEVVNAVNCARRGWVNVDMDIIACESCGARLLFSTPSSWSQIQVEKAALVFSLKLNSGHKRLCPWVDNACDETLVRFPPTSAADLVDNYKKRYAALLQLAALPVISSSAIEHIRCPQLEHFLNESSTVDYHTDAPMAKDPGSECESLSPTLFLQAQKLISLFGWEPRLLPYFVDCKDKESQSTKYGTLSDPSHAVFNGGTSRISIYSSGTRGDIGTNENPSSSYVQYDPSSIVLDCKLCGSTVGLWSFCTISRPVEFVRLTASSELNGESRNDNENGEHTANTIAVSTASSTLMLLNMTIAGGPPPALQNFRPKISLPVVGHNLRARIASEYTARYDKCLDSLYQGDKGQSSDTLISQHLQSDDMGLVDGKRLGNENCSSTSIELSPGMGPDINESVEGRIAATGGNEISADSTVESPLESTKSAPQIPDTVDKSEKVTSVEAVDQNAMDLCTSDVGTTALVVHEQVPAGNTETSMQDSYLLDVAVSDYLQQDTGSGKSCGKEGDSQNNGGLAIVQLAHENSDPCCSGNALKQLSAVKAMEFNPVMQHRHFCPWIASSGNSLPGWKQTLHALQRQQDSSYKSSPDSPSTSIIEVADPVGSVKRLFTPPSDKRKKIAHGSV